MTIILSTLPNCQNCGVKCYYFYKYCFSCASRLDIDYQDQREINQIEPELFSDQSNDTEQKIKDILLDSVV